MRIERNVLHTSAADCRSVSRGGWRGGDEAGSDMGPTGCYFDEVPYSPGANRCSGAFRYRVNVPVISITPSTTRMPPDTIEIPR